MWTEDYAFLLVLLEPRLVESVASVESMEFGTWRSSCRSLALFTRYIALSIQSLYAADNIQDGKVRSSFTAAHRGRGHRSTMNFDFACCLT